MVFQAVAGAVNNRQRAASHGDNVMPTPYPGNVTPVAQPEQDSGAAPIVRSIELSDLNDALRRGWDDFKAVPSHAIILCIIYPVLGLVLARTVLGYSVLPLLFPLAADLPCSARLPRSVFMN